MDVRREPWRAEVGRPVLSLLKVLRSGARPRPWPVAAGEQSPL